MISIHVNTITNSPECKNTKTGTKQSLQYPRYPILLQIKLKSYL